MKLRVFHHTTYRYRGPVTDSYNEVRLRPASDDPRRVEFFLLQVQPPVRLRHFRDDFLNVVHWFEIPEAHCELVIEATSVVHTTSPYPEGRHPLPMGFSDLMEQTDDGFAPFLGDSRYVVKSPEVWRLALDVRDAADDVFTTALAIMRHIHAGWEYNPEVTDATTSMMQVLEKRAGVCQDFAHLMIGMCRALRIPARYVSGYLYNGPSANLRGTQASHAWCEVWLPGQGWFGLDPTNDTFADERYVKIATGRDYDDAAPVRGHFAGPPGATNALEVVVEVERAD